MAFFHCDLSLRFQARAAILAWGSVGSCGSRATLLSYSALAPSAPVNGPSLSGNLPNVDPALHGVGFFVLAHGRRLNRLTVSTPLVATVIAAIAETIITVLFVGIAVRPGDGR